MKNSFYLKYRPQKIQDLDCTEAREELIKVFKSDKVPHAFLFSGTKGIGKTSAARIVAKAVNCTKTTREQTTDYRLQSTVDGKIDSRQKTAVSSSSFEPCNECSSCVSITNGTNIDVLEIDAASNRGIDDIKELREKIRLAPASAKYKVYIIDEVHMLTTEAFNALLKTLEEPPSHALFVLCTTDPEKLPKTIVSRCQRIAFKKATLTELVNKLEKICQAENLEFEKEALKEIARASEGSFRDGVKILEQVSWSEKITLEEVKKSLGILGEFNVDDFLELLQKKEIKGALLWLNDKAERGINLKILTEKVLERLRMMLLAFFGAGEGQPIFTLEEVKILIQLFSRAYWELKNAIIPQLSLEMAVAEWDMVGGEEKTEVGGGKLEKEVRNEKTKKIDQEIPPQSPASHFSLQTSYSIEDVLQKWPLILEKVKPLNHSVLAFLKACRPLACEDGFLILEVFYKFHKDQLETDKCRKIFEKSASEVLASPVKLKCSLSENPRPVKPLPKIEDFPPPVDKPIKKVAEKGEDDIIKMAEEIFNKNIQ
ncbi:MAG: DNA polymerase III subunit gamma/tau [Patescibacteria group bacterium]|nr:DNA polymerase III subunit gamma/tau [Patescibacteria group bacterium]